LRGLTSLSSFAIFNWYNPMIFLLILKDDNWFLLSSVIVFVVLLISWALSQISMQST
jgi:hypothetical protein